MRIKYIYLTLMILLGVPTCGYAAEGWIDVTDLYIKNARFDYNNSEYWNGTPFGFVNPMNNAEHYQKNFDTYQDLMNVPAGKYRLSLKGYYRAGDTNNDYSHFMYDGDNYRYAKLYATSSVGIYSVPLVYCYSGASTKNYGGAVSQADGKYVPNNMEAAHYWFEAGFYDNSVELAVGKDGILRIGISKDNTLSGDWTCIDSWKLEYWGEKVLVEKITLGKTSLELVVGEQYKLNATITPDNATNKTLNWQVGDETILSIDDDGVVTALKTGSTSIRATAVDGSGCYAMCSIKVSVNTATSDNIIINEIQSSNVDMFLDPSWNYGPWIELYNPTSKGVSLDGLYITDDAGNLKKYKFTASHGAVPANGYKTIWFDHYDLYGLTQVNFKPDYEGGTIIISDGTKILSQVMYPEIPSRSSYARTIDGGTKWSITANPTLEASNSTSVYANKQLDAPVIDKGGQLFTGSLTFNVTIPAGTTLVYTTDGTTPTETNGTKTTNGKFTVSSSKVYRFRLYGDGYLPSRVVTRSFIYKDRDYVFPIMSVVTNPDNIYSTKFGVFEQGPNGRPGNGQTSNCNWNMDWDRPVNMEYIIQDENGNYNIAAHNQEADLAVCGGWSRAWTPHSFKLKASKQYYGENFLSYPYFKEKPFIKNKTLQLRNGGNDTGCRIKDAALQEIVRRSGFYVDGQCWQPIHVFINGTYYDVLNMREPNNKHFAYANYGIDTDYMDQFEMSPDSGYVQMVGTDDAFMEWYNLSKTASSSSSYDRICELVDIDEYANYMAVEFYYGATDWPQNNFKGFRDRDNGKFHFVLFDLDGALSTTDPFNAFANKKNYTFDVLHGKGIEGVRRSAEIKLVTIFLNMLNNPTFRKRFIDSYCILGGSVVEAERVKSIVSEMSEYEGKNGFVYPSSTANSIISTLNSSYNNKMTNALKNYSAFKLTSTAKQMLNMSTNLADAKLYLNNIIVPTGKFNGYFFAPAVVKAEAPAGYKFVGWTSGATSKTTTIIANDAVWKYYDKGSLDGKSWTSASYSDNTWSSGKAPLGYAKSDLNTTISYGGNSNNKYPTYYFRRTVTLDEITPDATFKLDYIIDDGFIIYVNGVEAGRYNMPSGNVSYSTFATSYAQNNPDTGSLMLDSKLFKKGENIIAVEIHNNSATSTDIEWCGKLDMEEMDYSESKFISTNKEYTLPSSSTLNLTAVFEPLTSEEKADEGQTPIMINELSSDNEIYLNDYFKKNDWIELFNTTSEDIDVAGMYVSDNVEKPTKYQIPSYKDNSINTIVPAHGYLVIWCDKLEPVSQLHTSFKLGDQGGTAVISAADLSWNNSLPYPELSAWNTVGRYPDGGKKLYVFSKTTINSTNLLNSGDEEFIPVLPGDVNGDGVIDVADITSLAAYILGNPGDDFILENADVNQDGTIDVADITATAGIILANAKANQEFNFWQTYE